MSASVTDKDKGAKGIIERLKDASKMRVLLKVGVQAESGGVPHKSEGKSAPTVLDVAIFNEFGGGKVPARSFIRAWADENRSKIENDLKDAGDGILRQYGGGVVAMERLGLRYVGEIQQRIAAGIAPENAPSTIARKGSSKPLINTGQLRSSIKSKIEKHPVGSSGE